MTVSRKRIWKISEGNGAGKASGCGVHKHGRYSGKIKAAFCRNDHANVILVSPKIFTFYSTDYVRENQLQNAIMGPALRWRRVH